MMLLASFGPVFVVLPSLASLSIDHIAYCCRLWWFAGIGRCLMVEGEERGQRLQNQLELGNQH